MYILCLLFLVEATLQLKCDPREITAHIGGEFILTCKYDTNRFVYSKKYWCQGEARDTCAILVDSDGRTRSRRSQIVDAGRRGLFVKVRQLRFDDAGVYWVGIDKIYADIMTSIKVVVTEVPVSKPIFWPLSSLVDGPTCWGEPVTVRCGCTAGTAVRYAWYKKTEHGDVQLHNLADLYLQCGTMDKDSHYYCIAMNDISHQESDILSVQLLMPADSGCVYVINMQDQPIYDCVDRMSTTTNSPLPTTCQAMSITLDSRNQSLQTNQAYHSVFSWVRTSTPFWYTILRWCLFVSLLISLFTVIKCGKLQHKHVKRKRRGL